VSITSSDESAHGSLLVEAPYEAAEINVYDHLFRPVTHGAGRLIVELAPGVYEVETVLPDTSERQLTVVRPNLPTTVRRGSWHKRAQTVAPLEGAADTAGRHQELAREWSRKVTWQTPTGGTSRLFLFVRASPWDTPTDLASGLRLLDGQGRTLTDFRTGIQGDPSQGCLACTADLPPGPYLLRTENPVVRYQPLWLSPDYQTHAFLIAQNAPLLQSLSLSMAPLGRDFDPSDNEVLAGELVLDGLQRGRCLISPEQKKALRAGRPHNLWLGILACHALRLDALHKWEQVWKAGHSTEETGSGRDDRDKLLAPVQALRSGSLPRRDRLREVAAALTSVLPSVDVAHLLEIEDLLETTMGHLRPVLADHPDFRALELCDEKSAEKPFHTPPMLWASFRLVQSHATGHTETIPLGSLTDRAFDALLADGSWVAWRSLRTPTQTGLSVDARLNKDVPHATRCELPAEPGPDARPLPRQTRVLIRLAQSLSHDIPDPHPVISLSPFDLTYGQTPVQPQDISRACGLTLARVEEALCRLRGNPALLAQPDSLSSTEQVVASYVIDRACQPRLQSEAFAREILIEQVANSLRRSASYFSQLATQSPELVSKLRLTRDQLSELLTRLISVDPSASIENISNALSTHLQLLNLAKKLSWLANLPLAPDPLQEMLARTLKAVAQRWGQWLEKAADVASGLNAAIVITDATGDLQYANRAFRRLVGQGTTDSTETGHEAFSAALDALRDSKLGRSTVLLQSPDGKNVLTELVRVAVMLPESESIVAHLYSLRTTIQGPGDDQVLATFRDLLSNLVLYLSLFRHGADDRRQHYFFALADELIRTLRAVKQMYHEAISPGSVVQRVRSSAEKPNLRALPEPSTLFIGRKQQIEQAKELLLSADGRLLTLVGPGGSGKTRLALRVAAELQNQFLDGVFFVSLGAIRNPNLLVPTISEALRVPDSADRTRLEDLKEYLRERALLLVLDDCGHLGEISEFVKTLIQACPLLKLIVTSRTPLRTYAGQQLVVPPMELPGRLRVPEIGQLKEYDAIQLFVRRAQGVRQDFDISDDNAEAVVEICRRLSGQPLAIELVAARIDRFSPQELLTHVSTATALSFLATLVSSGRNPTAPGQVLPKVIAWSYDLLEEREKRLFQRLSVFDGGCTTEAAEKVCDRNGDVSRKDRRIPEIARALEDKHLVRRELIGDETRFGLLEPIGEYSAECLRNGGQMEIIREQHARYYVSLAEAAARRLIGPEQGRWFDRLEREHANIRAALRWSIGTSSAQQGLRLAGALWRFWRLRGYLIEGREWLMKVLECSSEPTPARAEALLGAGRLAIQQVDAPAAQPLLEESLAIFEKTNNNIGKARALDALGDIAFLQSDFSLARVRYSAAVAFLYPLLGTKSRIYLAWSYNHLGLLAQAEGNFDEAYLLMRKSCAIFEEEQDEIGRGIALDNLGSLALDTGDYDQARSLYEQSLSIRRKFDDYTGIASVLEGFATLLAAQGAPERALRLNGAALSMRKHIEAPRSGPWRERVDRKLEEARRAVGQNIDTLLSEGELMTPEQAIAYALQTITST
jgi:predicted ATPase/PAS domain-containing protein